MQSFPPEHFSPSKYIVMLGNGSKNSHGSSSFVISFGFYTSTTEGKFAYHWSMYSKIPSSHTCKPFQNNYIDVPISSFFGGFSLIEPLLQFCHWFITSNLAFNKSTLPSLPFMSQATMEQLGSLQHFLCCSAKIQEVEQHCVTWALLMRDHVRTALAHGILCIQ